MTCKKLLAVALLLMLLTFGAGMGLSQDRCAPFGGTLYAFHIMSPGPAWVGEGNFSIGNKVLRASVNDVPGGPPEIHDDMWWGNETATFDFGDGNTVQLVTEFTTEHMQNPSGVFHVNEIGVFANGTGRFQKTYGHFNSQGPFGPGVVLPAGKAPDTSGFAPDGLYWIGHYDGTICWADRNSRDQE